MSVIMSNLVETSANPVSAFGLLTFEKMKSSRMIFARKGVGAEARLLRKPREIMTAIRRGWPATSLRRICRPVILSLSGCWVCGFRVVN